MRRGALGLALAAFVIVGFVTWVGAMPKPAPGPLQAVAAQKTPAEASPEAADSPVSDEAGGPEVQVDSTTAISADPPLPSTPDAPAPDEWAEEISSRTRLPVASLRIYEDAASAQREATPGCGIGWHTLAALASPEDVHHDSIDATSRARAATLCEAGGDVAEPSGLEQVLTSHGRTPQQAQAISRIASTYASLAAS